MHLTHFTLHCRKAFRSSSFEENKNTLLQLSVCCNVISIILFHSGNWHWKTWLEKLFIVLKKKYQKFNVLSFQCNFFTHLVRIFQANSELVFAQKNMRFPEFHSGNWTLEIFFQWITFIVLLNYWRQNNKIKLKNLVIRKKLYFLLP